jgi:hypothetical protein
MKAFNIILAAAALGFAGCTVVNKEPPERDVVVQNPAGPGCTYLGTSYAAGSLSCQAGYGYQCINGSWVSQGGACP